LAQFSHPNRVPDVQIRFRWIKAHLQTKRFAGFQARAQTVCADNFGDAAFQNVIE
jgi:hypothetical protein